MYSNPPIHGAHIVNTILDNPVLRESWHRDLNYMSNRTVEMREGLIKSLK